MAEAVEVLRNLGHSSLGDQLARFLPHTSPLSRKGMAPGKSRRERRQEMDAETDRLRQEARVRAAGRGELCGFPLGAEDGELCHLDGGSGKRVQEQWIGNVLIEHHRCHQGPGGLDVKPTLWLPQVKAWAGRHGYPVPARFRKLEVLRVVNEEIAG